MKKLLQSIKDALLGKTKQGPWTVVEEDKGKPLPPGWKKTDDGTWIAPGLPDPNLPLVMPHRQSSVSRPVDPGPMPQPPLKTWKYKPPPELTPPFDNPLDLLDAASVPPLTTVNRNGDAFDIDILMSSVESFKKSPQALVVHTQPNRWHGSQANKQGVGITLHQTAVRRKP